jgi:predicted NUDIX family phosphoesterase
VSDVHSERVLVVPTAVFHRLGYFQGFAREVARYLPELFSPEHISYQPRRTVEQDPNFKQLIPYVVFRYRDAAGRESVFQYTRGTGMGEGRLHRKHSVGIGGHISSTDAENGLSGDPYKEGMRRELEEEVAIDTPYHAECVGLINDDLTEVGRVHLGVVHICDLTDENVSKGEACITDLRFLSLPELLERREHMETWSQICLDLIAARAGVL